MTHDDARELLGAYALDALSPDERDAVEAHLRHCARCRAEVADLASVTDQLALLAIERDPPPALRGRLLALVEQDRSAWERARASGSQDAHVAPGGAETMVQDAAVTQRGTFSAQQPAQWWQRLVLRVRRSPMIIYASATALAAVLIVLGVLLFNRNNVNILHTYACAPAQQTLIDGNDYTPTTCTLSVRSDHRMTVAFSSLPVLSNTQAYELWMIPATGRPVPVGGFVPNGDLSFYTVYPVKSNVGSYAKAAVTIERAPGNSPVPRGPIALVIPFAHPVVTQS